MSPLGGASAQTWSSIQAHGRLQVLRLGGQEPEVCAACIASGQEVTDRSFEDAGDFYRVRGKKKELYRSTSRLLVRFGKGVSPQVRSQICSAEAALESVDKALVIPGYGLSILRLKEGIKAVDLRRAIVRLAQKNEVNLVSPVYISKDTGRKLYVSDEFIIKLRAGVTEDELATQNNVQNVAVLKRLRGAEDQYLLRLREPVRQKLLETLESYFESDMVEWAEPNFIFQPVLAHLPNDTRYPDQWHLHNTGQGGGTPDADVDAPEAWDITTGDSGISIAIIDTGVDLDHPDLADRLLPGYDFYDDDDDPDPGESVYAEPHGTACAGVAAATLDNAEGVAGVAGGCSILPVKITSDGTEEGIVFASYSAIAEAIRWAADNADVLSNSWGDPEDSEVVHSAIQYAKTSGRGGKGCPVFCASGNSATAFVQLLVLYEFGTPFPYDTYTLVWEYAKDGSISVGEDSVWLDAVVFPTGEIESFEGTFPPPGWSTYGDAPWTQSATHVHTGIDAGTYSAKAGDITHGETTWLQVTKEFGGDYIIFSVWVSSECDLDALKFDTFTFYMLDSLGWPIGWIGPACGVDEVDPDVLYPASYPEAIAVGACTNFGYRSDYSQHGANLDIVAPSDGGTVGITTTDIGGESGMGSYGYWPGDYVPWFGGTSSASPLAAGVAALVLSQDPSLTADEVRTILQNTADKIGDEPYSAGRNDLYGYGRVNARCAIATASCAANFDFDCDVDHDDFDIFQGCLSGPEIPHNGSLTCQQADFDGDNDVDQTDFGIFQQCYSGQGNPPNPNCAD